MGTSENVPSRQLRARNRTMADNFQTASVAWIAHGPTPIGSGDAEGVKISIEYYVSVQRVNPRTFLGGWGGVKRRTGVARDAEPLTVAYGRYCRSGGGGRSGSEPGGGCGGVDDRGGAVD